MKKVLSLLPWVFVAAVLFPCQAIGDSKEDAIRLYHEADALYRNARTHEALKTSVTKHEQALRIFQQLGAKEWIVWTYLGLGASYAAMGENDKAMEWLEKSRVMARETRDSNAEGIALGAIGQIYEHWGKYDKAVDLYEKGLAIQRKVKDRKVEAQTLHKLGRVYIHWGKYAKAEELCQQSLAIRRETHDRLGEGTTLGTLADIYASQDQYDKALKLMEKSLAIHREVKYRRGEAESLGGQALIYRHWGQNDRAVELLEKSLAIYRELHDPGGQQVGLGNLADVYKSWGQYDKAVRLYEKSLAISREQKNPKVEATVLSDLGSVYASWGQYDEALGYYEKALAIQRDLKNPIGQASVLLQIGDVYGSWSQYDEAMNRYEKALSMFHELKNQSGEGASLRCLGSVYLSWGQYDKAMEYYEKCLAISRELKDRHGEGSTLALLGDVYQDLGKYDEAVDYYEKSISIKRELKDRHGEAETLMNLGGVFQNRGNYRRALENFQEALAIFTEIKVPTNYAKANMADTYMDMGDLIKAELLLPDAGYDPGWGRFYLLKPDYPKAKEYYEKILKSAEKNRNADNLFTAYTGLGKVYEAFEDYKQAEEYYGKGMKLTEEIRSSLLPAERKNFFEVMRNGFQRSEPAKGLTRVRMKLNEAAGSIDSSEVTRARAFSDNIALTTKAGTGVPRQVLQKENELVSKVAALKKQLRKTDKETSPATYGNISQQVQDAEAELNTFVQVLWEKYKPYASVKYPRPVTLKESALKPEEYVVIFDVSGEGVGVKLIKGKEIAQTFYTKWKSEDLERDVKKFRQAFEEMKLKEFDPELGRTLYKKLLSAVLGDVPDGAPLVIIPDGILAILPFEALVFSGKPTWKEEGNRPYPEGLTYLGDLYPISYYQSITAMTLARTLRSKEKPGAKTLVIADPVFEPDDARFKTSSAKEQQKMLAALPEKLMSIKDQTGITFPRLSKTAELAESLKKLNPGKTDLFTGMKAKKSILFDKPLTDYGSIVFATHGYFGTDIPGIREPVLAMTLVDQPKDEDGFVRMTEVMGMKLNANVVALTACQTGLGNNLAGEGVMSMGKAFQYAGAKAILMSLWSVSESGSVLLVEKFFEHLKGGKNKLDALKSAREDVRNAGYKHPFYWASFILVGEVD